jgi:integrative and conjugative element protein (TIGR02256 family)
MDVTLAMLKKNREMEKIEIMVSSDVILVFDKYKQFGKDSVEACGILIGRHSVDGRKINIDIASQPSESDIRKKYYFKMDSNHHQQLLDNQFIKSQNESVYLGTWHSHPELIPIPSIWDIIDWKKQFKENKHLFDNMIFIIVGQRVIKYWLINNGVIFEIKQECILHDN